EAGFRAGPPVRLHLGDGDHDLRGPAGRHRQPGGGRPLLRRRPTDQILVIDQRAADLQVTEGERPSGPGRGTPRPYLSESWLRLRENRWGTAAGVLILVLAAIAIAAPLFSALVTHHDPGRQDLAAQFLPPGRS